MVPMQELMERVCRIEMLLERMMSSVPERPQEYYSTADVARLLGKAEWTVREWCRLGRVVCEKRATGRGNSKEWMISHQELCRIRSEGLLPWNSYPGRHSPPPRPR